MSEIEFTQHFLFLVRSTKALAILKFCCMLVVVTYVIDISPVENTFWLQGPHVGFF